MRNSLLVIGSALALAGCGGATSPAGTVTATYALESVDGSALPFTLDSTVVGGTTTTRTQLLSQQITTLLNQSVPNEISLTTVSVERLSGPTIATRADTTSSSQTVAFDGVHFTTTLSVGTIAGNSMMIVVFGGTTYSFVRTR